MPINAGYMVLEPQVFDYLDGDDCVFEREPLRKLAEEGQLMSYQHKGVWQCMDTLREKRLYKFSCGIITQGHNGSVIQFARPAVQDTSMATGIN